jgi:anti-sigma factor RsiW
MKGDREVAGLWCHEVLAGLSEYLDGELPDDSRGQVESHLSQCDTCANFGGQVSMVVSALKDKLANPAPLPNPLRDTLVRAIWKGAAKKE